MGRRRNSKKARGNKKSQKSRRRNPKKTKGNKKSQKSRRRNSKKARGNKKSQKSRRRNPQKTKGNKKSQKSRRRKSKKSQERQSLPCGNDLNLCTDCEVKLHQHQIVYGVQARNWKRQIERAMNDLLNLQKKFNTAPDFSDHGDHFSLFGNSSCRSPPVKSEYKEPNKTASECAADMAACKNTLQEKCVNPDGTVFIEGPGSSV